MSGNATPTRVVTASGNDIIDGILTTTAWDGGFVEYSFPTTNATYSYLTETDWPANMFGLNASQQTAVHFALNADIGPIAADGFSVEGFTNLTITQDTTPDSGDTIRIANTTSTTLGTAAVADFPGNSETFEFDDNGDVFIQMTLTAPGCPVAGVLPGHLAKTVGEVDGVGRVEVELTWDPPWTPALMSEEARVELNMF